MFYPNNIEQKIDFTVIREELNRRCSSPLGRERVEAMQMETDYETVQHLLGLTDQMRLAENDPMLTFPRGDIHDVREAIARIRIEGLFLDEAELDALRHSLSYAAELERFFAGLDELRYPLLKELRVTGYGLQEIVKSIDAVGAHTTGDNELAGERRTYVGFYFEAGEDGRFCGSRCRSDTT